MRTFATICATRFGKATSLALAVGLLLGGCAVEAGPGYGYGYGGGVGVDYYEPYGAVYGGWDSGYNVGPYRGRGDWHGGGGGPRSFHAAPGRGGPPSIPSGGRGGAHGGGHGGGGGGGRR
jgi:hypothetical protein